MKYIDYETGSLEGPRVDSDGFSVFMYKRRSFAYEQEVRIIATNGMSLLINDGDTLKTVPGVRVPVDPRLLIEGVHVAPTTPEWFRDVVKAVVSKYEIAEDLVQQSALAASPIY
jgi:hypothetical protein